jgi:hypothetical protein
MATEADKYLETQSPEEKKKIVNWAINEIDKRKIPTSRVEREYPKLVLEYKYKKQEVELEKRRVEYLKNNPLQIIKPPAKEKQPSTQEKQPVRDVKPPSQVIRRDEVPPKLKTDKTIPVYYEKEAEDVPSRYDTGIENMSKFRFRSGDTYEEMMAKINYIKAILKNKKVSQRKTILQYYEFRISIEKRSNQQYYYGSKNIKNTMYRFYIGRATLKQPHLERGHA